jgi:hypothetical protein
MLFGKKKQNTLTETDLLLRDAEKVLPIKAYYARYGQWGKNTRKINYLQPIGGIDIEGNSIYLFGKVKAGVGMYAINGMHSKKDGRSYLYFREHNRLIIVKNGRVDDTMEPSFNLTDINMLHSYVNNMIAVKK